MFIGLSERANVEHLRALFCFAARTAFTDLSTTAFRIALEPETSRLVPMLADMGVRVVGKAFDMRLIIAQV